MDMIKPLPTQDDFNDSTITVVADNGEGGVVEYKGMHQCSSIEDSMIGFYDGDDLVIIPTGRIISITYKFKQSVNSDLT